MFLHILCSLIQHVLTASASLLCCHRQVHCFFLLQKSGTITPFSTLLLYSPNVLLADCVPSRHILLHTLRETCRFAARKGRAGFRYTLVEAVVIEFLDQLPGVGHCCFLPDLVHDRSFGVRRRRAERVAHVVNSTNCFYGSIIDGAATKRL